jgi:hypothetical protein
MGTKKYKRTTKNTGAGDVVILSSTSHYTSRGLVEKKTVSKHDNGLEISPSKSPEKPTHGLTPRNATGSGYSFDEAMMEPLKLPQSRVSDTFSLAPSKATISRSVFDYYIYQSQNDYMREYLDKREFYMARIIASEAGSPERLCASCGMVGDWRCTDCLGHPIYCINCCRSNHATHPFHRVQRWVGEYFEDSWLIQTGVTIHFGHGGKPCPSIHHQTPISTTNTSPTPTSPVDFGLPDNPEEVDDTKDDLDAELSTLLQMEVDEDGEMPPTVDGVEEQISEGYIQAEWNFKDKTASQCVLVIVHFNGVHHLPVQWCQCPGQLPQDIQALDLHFFPASFRRVRTLFTFQCLDSFLAENQECKSSAWHYYQKLRRFTSGSFPHVVPDRYRELLRCTRQYRNLKHLKWHGFGHDSRPAGLGELSVQCPACPQPGVNLPENWEEDKDE